MARPIYSESFTNKIATWTGAAFMTNNAKSLTAQLVVDLLGAPTSPTLDVALQTSNDGVNWVAMPAAWAFSQKTADAVEFKQLAGDLIGAYARFVYTVGGTGYAAGTKTWNSVAVHVAGA